MKISAEIEKLSFVEWSDLRQLPNCPAIYFVVDSKNIIQYIGQAKDLEKRWRNHHRKFQLDQINEKYPIRLYWIILNLDDLKTAEKHFIEKYKPLLNSTIVETPEVIPSEVILKQLLRKIARKICVIGISENPSSRLKTVYAKFDAQNCTKKGAAAIIKKFQVENKGSSLKIKKTKYVSKIYGEVYRVGSRKARRQALENRTYNNHWEIGCNGVIIDITPENGLHQLAFFKERAIPWKLANVTIRALKSEDFLEIQEKTLISHYKCQELSPININIDPIPILWKNWESKLKE